MFPLTPSVVNLSQAERLRSRLQDLEKLLAQFDCRSRFGKQHHLSKNHMTKVYEHEHQREDALPNALEDFLAFQGNGRLKPVEFHSACHSFESFLFGHDVLTELVGHADLLWDSLASRR